MACAITQENVCVTTDGGVTIALFLISFLVLKIVFIFGLILIFLRK